MDNPFLAHRYTANMDDADTANKPRNITESCNILCTSRWYLLCGPNSNELNLGAIAKPSTLHSAHTKKNRKQANCKKIVRRSQPAHLNNEIPAKLLKIRVGKLFDCVCVWTSADMRKHPFTGQYWKNGSVILTLCMPCILRSSTCKASNRAMNYNTSSVAPFFFTGQTYRHFMIRVHTCTIPMMYDY